MRLRRFHASPSPRTRALISYNQDPDRTKLAGFLCPYFGAVKVVSEAHTDENGEEVPATSASFLVLQDMCSGLDNPCAMDVKMGRTTVEPGEREVIFLRFSSESLSGTTLAIVLAPTKILHGKRVVGRSSQLSSVFFFVVAGRQGGVAIKAS